MVSRRTAVLLGLALLAVVVLTTPAVGGDQPTITVENDGSTAYRVSAYAAEDTQRATLTNFEVTTRDGDRRLATVSQLYWPDRERNPTLVDEGVASERVVAEPGENVTVTFDDWDQGDTLFYFVERRSGDDWIHDWRIGFSSCGGGGQEITVEAGSDGIDGLSETCSSGLL